MIRKTKVEILHVPKSEWPESIKQQFINPYMDDCAEAYERGYKTGVKVAIEKAIPNYARQVHKNTLVEIKQLVREMIFNGNPDTQSYKQALDDVLTALENMQ